MTANLDVAKSWRSSYPRKADGDGQGWAAVAVVVFLEGSKMQMLEDGSLSAVEEFFVWTTLRSVVDDSERWPRNSGHCQ